MKVTASSRMMVVSALSAIVAIAVSAAGCRKEARESDRGKDAVTSTSGVGQDDGHDHGGWWCSEHGVPEEDCSICSSSAAARFKEKGDWCAEHGRAESQCFLCDSSRAEKFAKLYEAKFGHAPPKPIE